MLPLFLSKYKRITIIVTCILFLSLVLLSFSLRRSSRESSPFPTRLPSRVPTKSPQTSPRSILYATLTSELTARIFESTGSTTSGVLRTTLAFPVKNIVQLDRTTLLYMKNLDPFERSTDIVMNREGREQKLVESLPEFVFDRFIVSPDKKQLVAWEVSQNPFLAGAETHLILIPLRTPQNRTVLLTETAGEYTHYPFGWAGNQNVLIDSVSTYGDGMYRGLFTLDIQSKTLQPLLQPGEYNSLPLMVPGEDRFVYTAFTPTTPIKLSTKSEYHILTNAEVRNPNSIIEYDLRTAQKTILRESLNGELYFSLALAPDGQRIAYNSRRIDQTRNEALPSGTRLLNRISRQETPLDESVDSGNVISWLTDDDLIVAKLSTTVTFLGGFLSPYAPLLEGVYLFSLPEKTYTKILGDSAVQILEVF